MAIASIDPRTGETTHRFEALSPLEIEAKLERAERAFAAWRRTSYAERGAPMQRAAALLGAERDAIARTMTEEMGKTLASALAEVDKCAKVCGHYAEYAERYLADEPIATEAESYVRYLPLGAVLAVMPWNFPLWQVFRFVAPTLMAGNVGLLKHASNVPRCALAIDDLLRRAGFPEGVFQTLLVGADAVPTLIADRRVVAVTLTGSEQAGASVAAHAGQHLKPSVLELGGSDPFIVMPSADLGAALAAALASRTLNNGQSCINAKRFVVHREVYDDFEAGLCEAFAKLRVGDPMDPSTEIGPLALASVRRDVVDQVERSIARGARLLVGGKALSERGHWFEPGVLVGRAARVCRPPRGDLRPRGDAHPRREPRRSDRRRQRQSLRPRQQRVDERRTRDRAPRERARRWADLRERHGRLGSEAALRWHQSERLRPRARRAQGIRAFVNTKTVWAANSSG
jgi:succinate-semialdehyde dehydrogenase / glutarate-semialdehyde dehydrogenase